MPLIEKESWYSELDIQAGDIRLVVLYPGKTGEPIRCSLIQESLTQVRSYEALSYTWGDPRDTKPILLNERPFSATKNLEAALRHLRYEDDNRFIWIDAICINQNDIRERNLQVRRMLKIYSSAAQVLVWLGEGNEQSDKAMDFMIRISKSKANLEFPWEDESLIPSEDECIALAENILTRPWFQRCWVIQEVAVAKEIIVICGLKTTGWHYLFRSTVQAPLKYSSSAPTAATVISIDSRGCCATIDSIRREYIAHTGRHSVLSQLMLWSASFQSTLLAVDRMYSMLGLARDVQDPSLDPDYLKPVWEVLTIFTRFILQQEGDLNFLCTNLRDNGIEELPSWVPNFTMRKSAAANPLKGTSDEWDPGRRLFDIFGDFASTVSELFSQSFDDVDRRRRGDLFTAAGTRPMVVSFMDLRFIKISGVLNDEIKSIGPSWNPDTTISQRWRSYQTILAKWAAMIATPSCGANIRYGIDGLQLAFSKTLTADRWFGLNHHADLIRFPLDQGFLDCVDSGKDLARDNAEENARNWALMLLWSSHYRRRFMVSKEGYIGLVPETTRPGDNICVLFGCSTPVILRQEGDSYRFIGEW